MASILSSAGSRAACALSSGWGSSRRTLATGRSSRSRLSAPDSSRTGTRYSSRSGVHQTRHGIAFRALWRYGTRKNLDNSRGERRHLRKRSVGVEKNLGVSVDPAVELVVRLDGLSSSHNQSATPAIPAEGSVVETEKRDTKNHIPRRCRTRGRRRNSAWPCRR